MKIPPLEKGGEGFFMFQLIPDSLFKIKFTRHKKLLIFFTCFWLFSLPAFSQNKLKTIDIQSDSFNMKLEESEMTFEKNVAIRYEALNAKCDKALITFEAATGKVLQIIMQGNVSLQKEKTLLKGQKVIFEPSTQRLTVEGNVSSKINF